MSHAKLPCPTVAGRLSAGRACGFRWSRGTSIAQPNPTSISWNDALSSRSIWESKAMSDQYCRGPVRRDALGRGERAAWLKVGLVILAMGTRTERTRAFALPAAGSRLLLPLVILLILAIPSRIHSAEAPSSQRYAFQAIVSMDERSAEQLAAAAETAESADDKAARAARREIRFREELQGAQDRFHRLRLVVQGESVSLSLPGGDGPQVVGTGSVDGTVSAAGAAFVHALQVRRMDDGRVALEPADAGYRILFRADDR
jgi:hypothetical protein